MRITKRHLRKIIKEELGRGGGSMAGSGLPSPVDVGKKLSRDGAEEAMEWLARVMRNMSFGAAAPEPEPEIETPPPVPASDEEL